MSHPNSLFTRESANNPFAGPSISRRLVAGSMLALLLTSCATTQLPPISAGGAAFQPLPDELQLWQDARAEEQKMLEEVRVYQDPLLVDYLESVAHRLTPPGMVDNPEIRYRITVLEDPTLNAFAFPHGALYIHTGLLARLENEAQLATVLGHEMSHVEYRHTVRYRRSQQNRQIGFAIASVAAAVIIAGEQGDALEEGRYGKAARIGVLADVFVGLGLQLAFLAAVNGYGRNLEYEADQGAFAKLDRGGYDPRQAPRIYELLQEGHGESSNLEVFFFGSHPQLQDRVTNAEAWVANRPEPNAPYLGDELSFERRIRPVIRDDARLNIEIGRYALAESQLTRVLDALSEDPEGHFLFARLRLAQAEQTNDPGETTGLRQAAREALAETLRLAPGHAEAHRELGLLDYAEGRYGAACEAFRQYVELAPSEEDTARIRDYLLELKRDRHCR